MRYLEQNKTSIKQWAEEDRPREKLMLKGKSVLSEAELIGILIGSGTRTLTAVDLAKQILHSVDNNLNLLARLSVNELKKFKGIGEAKAINIVSALELGRRRKEADQPKVIKITTSKTAYDIMHPYLQDVPHEEFWVLLLNRANHLIKPVPISQGGLSGTVADPKLIFNSALEALASGVILVHNHPSGSLKPSKEDINLTKQLKEAGRVLEIPVLDHLIYTNSGYFSMADAGVF